MTNSPAPNPAAVSAERSRLIDYFKRLFAIVAGLAITEAVKRVYPSPSQEITWPSIWTFGTFLVTIIPIFHGGDRSLDVKYLNSNRITGSRRIAYIWDVYMLVITAILFVCIAEAIPRADPSKGYVYSVAESSMFYNLMAIMLVFDVMVLVVDFLKTPEAQRADLSSYLVWIPANLILAGLCYGAGSSISDAPTLVSAADVVIACGSINFQELTFYLFIAAVIRMFADYWAGRAFLFP